MRVQILYIDGCPNYEATADLVRSVVREYGVDSAVETVEVRSAAEATSLRFLGSPTVQIDGVDVDPTARARTDFAVGCRLYGVLGVPAADMIAVAIREASAQPPPR